MRKKIATPKPQTFTLASVAIDAALTPGDLQSVRAWLAEWLVANAHAKLGQQYQWGQVSMGSDSIDFDLLQQQKLALCHLALGAPTPVAPVIEPVNAFMQRVAQIDITCCTHCKHGHFHAVAAIMPNDACRLWSGPPQTGPPP
jgi:hypothetical protein